MGSLVIANGTPYRWLLMEEVLPGFPPSVTPGEVFRVSLELGDNEDSVVYRIAGAGKNTRLHINIAPKAVTVDLTDVLAKGKRWFPVPPPPASATTIELGSPAGNTLSFTLGGSVDWIQKSFVGASLAPPPSPGKAAAAHGDGGPFNIASAIAGCLGHDSRAVDGGGGGEAHVCGGTAATTEVAAELPPWTADWMAANKTMIQDLRLHELSLPGTHDSGTYDMALQVAAPWARTQRLDIRGQLEAGARCLDLRVGYKGGGAGEGLILVHDRWRTSVSLREALEAVAGFTDAHQMEIVLLDFHRFPDLGEGGMPYEAAAALVRDVLGEGRLIPPARAGQKLRALWSEKSESESKSEPSPSPAAAAAAEPAEPAKKPKPRVAVLWSPSEGRDAALFWPGITQAWRGDKKVKDLQAFMGENFAAPPGGGGGGRRLWSMPAVLPAGVGGVPRLAPELDEWFAVGNRWQRGAAVVSVDFMEESFLVRNCVGTCLLKAAQAFAGAA